MNSTGALVRAATLFYAVLAAFAVAWGWLFDSPVLGEHRPGAGGIGMGLALGLALVAFSHLLRLLPSARRLTDALVGLLGPLTVPQALWLAALSGLAEEICFRGALWRQLGFVGTSILFGLCHVVPRRELAGFPLYALFAGLLLGRLRDASGSVWPSVTAHVTVNALNLAWIGARARRGAARPPHPPHTPSGHLPAPTAPAPNDPVLPDDLGVADDFPITVWRYDLRVEPSGTDRENLPLCLEAEDLSLFAHVPREQVYAELRNGLFLFAGSFEDPLPGFAHDVATLSAYLFETLVGIEVAERHVDEHTTDDVRAWKIVAQRGEWVKVPLVVEAERPDRFVVDPDREDLAIVEARWAAYPRWFQDGMRFKYPRLRDL